MKKLFLLLILFSLVAITGFSQTWTVKKKNVHYKPTDKLMMKEASAAPSPSPVRFTSISTNVTFTEISQVNGKWTAGSNFTIGQSWLFSYANGQVNSDSSITIQQQLSFGFGFNWGVTENSSGILVGSLPVGAELFYSSLGLFGGYDVLNSRTMIGVSYNLAGLSLFPAATHFSQLPK